MLPLTPNCDGRGQGRRAAVSHHLNWRLLWYWNNRGGFPQSRVRQYFNVTSTAKGHPRSAQNRNWSGRQRLVKNYPENGAKLLTTCFQKTWFDSIGASCLARVCSFNVCSPEDTSDTSTNYDSFLNWTFSSPNMVRTVQTLLHSQLACNEMQASADAQQTAWSKM